MAERLGGDRNGQGPEEEAAFYFQQLERLEIDLLVAEIEVALGLGRWASNSGKSRLLKTK